MAATLLSRCYRIYNCDACKCVSSENHQTTGKRSLEFDSRFSKPVRLVLRDRYKVTKQLNDPALTRALRGFADSGLMEDALQLFDEMNKADTFVWNVMIKGFTSCGLYFEALQLYCRMVFSGVKADSFTYPFVIKSVTGISSLEEGKKIHAMVIKLRFVSDVYVCNSLISLYMKLGCSWDAEKVFEEMPERDIVSWNSMISGYLALEDGFRSLMLFKEMLKFGFKPDRFSTMSALGACSHVYSPNMGKELHCHAVRSRIETGDVMKMSEQNGLQPDVITLINLLPACAILEGRTIHGYAMRRGFLPHIVLDTALIDMYGEWGQLKSAEVIFDRIAEKNLISWNSIIAAYVQNGKNYSALELFQKLWDSSLLPDSTTIASILPAYAESLSLSEGRQIHAYIVKSRYGSNTIILNSLVHMYAMCGDLEDARKCFNHVLLKDVVSWNSIIMAYAVHGFGRISVCLFSEMIASKVDPNKSTFASLLAACSISGMVDEGWEYFESMKREYGIDPGIEHYGYMLDLIGRTGNFSSAKRFIREMPFLPTARIWGSLLNASRNHNDITVAEFAAEQIFKMEHDNTGCYVLLLNMYAEARRWEDVNRIKLLMESKGISRTSSRSTVEAKSKTHVLTNGDRSHVETNKIYEVLDIVSRMIGEEEEEDSYVHYVSKLRRETLAKSRSNSPRRHSVRLATCFGLISTETGRTVTVRNNTRICRKCHEFLEKASKMTRREIVVGDSKIFHHFSNGRCSCGNYW
ncbi:pentatricopeptide repeat-containing protein At4g35130, chloroplastic [Arabidopsis lyrata subsp. lyrata]|uniref:pentatricopeptide repeat-containing protein At4g35130, chloroplastic n=1 Tax=Arabidopsis lyrata subsp. lyrata TaxID=81972 RepID=UPI000A29D672|nr:pentatricopeptide repeat-containing protein At4g35130, chloroplastic [Arabidopsis lyrata subsp. lyrata]|eukprot:XP_020874359.1 pentatricopeptide repeat-containing protein At4g35130, chloroplastic [Arabidopsis lyrata subsp. lyrata]